MTIRDISYWKDTCRKERERADKAEDALKEARLSLDVMAKQIVKLYSEIDKLKENKRDK